MSSYAKSTVFYNSLGWITFKLSLRCLSPSCQAKLHKPMCLQSAHSFLFPAWMFAGAMLEVLLLQWMDMSEINTTMWNVVELFSGAGNVSAVFRKHGRAVASFDKELGGDCMDMTNCAGFLPGPQEKAHICVPFRSLVISKSKANKGPNSWGHELFN